MNENTNFDNDFVPTDLDDLLREEEKNRKPPFKEVCQLDEHGFFDHMTLVQLCPITESYYLLPPNTIEQDEPTQIENKIPKWDKEKEDWVYIDDYYGKTFYSTKTGEPFICELKGQYPENATLDPKPSEIYVYDKDKQQWVISENLENKKFLQMKVDMLHVISAKAQKLIDDITTTGTTPEFEKSTWVRQAAEVQAWMANHDAPTPTLEIIAHARGVPLDQLRQKAAEKAQAYAVISAKAAGIRQSIEDKIKQAKSIQDLQDINTDIVL